MSPYVKADLSYAIDGRITGDVETYSFSTDNPVWVKIFPTNGILSDTYWPYIYIDAFTKQVIGISDGTTGKFTPLP